MTTPKTTAPVYYKFSDLDIDPILSGRSDKEIRDNAKSLAPEMAAAGGWDAMQPGQVATGANGKPRVVAGFTRIAASQLNGEKGGYFFEIEGASELDLRLKCIATNGGKPVNRFQQGALFQMLRGGIVADDFKGTLADPKNPDHWKIPPMSDVQIGEKVGKNREHIRQCVIIFESSPDIRVLIETDQISYGVVEKARSWARDKETGIIDDVKALKALRGAIREAGGERVTLKHLEAVKAQFFPLRAVSKDKPKDKPKDKKKDEGEGGDENNGDTGEREESDRPERETSGEPQEELNLGLSDAPKPPTPKKGEGIRAELVAVITKFNAERGTGQMDKTEIENLTDWLITCGVIVAEMPF